MAYENSTVIEASVKMQLGELTVEGWGLFNLLLLVDIESGRLLSARAFANGDLVFWSIFQASEGSAFRYITLPGFRHTEGNLIVWHLIWVRGMGLMILYSVTVIIFVFTKLFHFNETLSLKNHTISGLSSVAETTMDGVLGEVKGTGWDCFTVTVSKGGTSCFVGSVGRGLSFGPVGFPLDKTPFHPFILPLLVM